MITSKTRPCETVDNQLVLLKLDDKVSKLQLYSYQSGTQRTLPLQLSADVDVSKISIVASLHLLSSLLVALLQIVLPKWT
jgi:hypothetical protein